MGLGRVGCRVWRSWATIGIAHLVVTRPIKEGTMILDPPSGMKHYIFIFVTLRL